MIKSKKQMYLVIGAFALILMLGTVTYAFFNYTRTGTANTIKTGRIYFLSTQGNDTLGITNVFPMTSDEAEAALQNSQLDAVTVVLEGDTTYANGEEYVVTITQVNNVSNNKVLPLNYIASYEAYSGEVIGTVDNTTYYTTTRGGVNPYYTINETGNVETGARILAGFIPAGEDGIKGTLTVSAYVDKDRIAITDTYDTTESDNMGTTVNWVDGRTYFTTEEWEHFQDNATPISFKIKAEANEGVWVPANAGHATLTLSPTSGSTTVGTPVDSTITTNATGANAGAITCSTSDDTVATCAIANGTLTVTPVAAGTATITVVQAADDTYAMPATASYNLTVTE